MNFNSFSPILQKANKIIYFCLVLKTKLRTKNVFENKAVQVGWQQQHCCLIFMYSETKREFSKTFKGQCLKLCAQSPTQPKPQHMARGFHLECNDKTKFMLVNTKAKRQRAVLGLTCSLAAESHLWKEVLQVSRFPATGRDEAKEWKACYREALLVWKRKRWTNNLYESSKIFQTSAAFSHAM